MHIKKPILILLLILVLALAFKITAVLNTSSLWFDEVVSLKIAQHSIIDSWQYLKWENNPPLHYWFLHYWIKIFNQSEIFLRFSSILFSLLSIIAIYFLGRRLYNHTVGLFAAFLTAISSYQLFLSMDARMYPMIFFFGLLSSYFFYQTLDQPKKLNWFLYILFTLLTFYTHLVGFFLFFAQNIYFIYHRYCLKKNQPQTSSWALSQLIILILFSPWLITFISRSFSTFNSSAWYLHTQGGGFIFLQIPRTFLFLGNKFPFIELVALIIFTTLFILSFVKIHSWLLAKQEFKIQFNFTPQVIFLLTIFLIPLIAGFLTQLWVSKYYIISSIGFYLLLAVGFNNLKIKDSFKAILLALIFILTLPYNLSIIQINQHSWNQVAEYIQAIEQPGDKVLISAFVYQIPFAHYYQGNSEVVGFQPIGLEDDLLLKTVKYNWYPVLTEDNMPDLNEILGDNKRVIVVNPSVAALIHNANLVLDWFVHNNWPLEHKEQFGGFIQPTVFIFQNPN